ncbi:hypothetical protein CRU99_05325 [Malaciobacter mytili]|uniref:HD-GYP domain-containing protein n=1 Tax=Malaciobacter mytili LMG 24559 TaxID=1032238 RepID=A0AAX2AJE5_9BACT|nr:HD-GYP domain-containing protein [Malaciobacter mytili]AXH15147.1 c-di-GMP phosphodiesterase, class II (HD-GYP domain) [Malaciobacter mytili LMG 24559]RXI44371.1 hypothetical protein CRU99_05325 [Malaciobacter mytili]RXK15656.1 hypothetical protein CP985_07805 [Malaciobacter mytili LMG 24559]
MQEIKTSKFFPIAKETLKYGEKYPYSIYRRVDERIFSLLLQKNEIFKKSTQCFMVDENNTKLYVKDDDKQYYQLYIQNHIRELLEDEKINIDVKATFIKEIASETMNDLFESDVNCENLSKINNIIDTTVKLILTEKNAMYSMLKVTSYDYYTYTHCIDVATYAIGFGTYLNLSKEQLELLGRAAMLHDIGKKKIPHSIITKNGKLTKEEFEIVKSHPTFSVEVLKESGESNELLLKLIEQHHEKCDGTGYPKGLKEQEIEVLAKIISVCDVFNALTTRRTYKDRMSSYEAFKIMNNEMKNHLCALTLRNFICFMGCNKDLT